MILGVRHFAVSSISEKLETKFQKLEEDPESEDRPPSKGKKAAPYTNKLCKGAAFLVGALRKEKPQGSSKAEPPCGFVGLAIQRCGQCFSPHFCGIRAHSADRSALA